MKLTKSKLLKIVQETIKEVSPAHMPYGETPEGGLDPEYTREEDIRFRQQLEQEKELKMRPQVAAIFTAAELDYDEIDFVLRALRNPDVARGFLETSAYDKLLGYFMKTEEIPYAIAKARTGDPDYWILNYLNNLGSTMRGGPASLAAEQKNRKITKSQLLKIIREELYKVFYEKHSPKRGGPVVGDGSMEVEADSLGKAMKKVQDENPTFHAVKAEPVKKEKDKK